MQLREHLRIKSPHVPGPAGKLHMPLPFSRQKLHKLLAREQLAAQKRANLARFWAVSVVLGGEGWTWCGGAGVRARPGSGASAAFAAAADKRHTRAWERHTKFPFSRM